MAKFSIKQLRPLGVTGMDVKIKLWSIGTWAAALVAAVFAYVLSSGPVMATGFWLRDVTGWNGFYWVMLPYVPVLALGHDQPIDAYIEWWVRLFGTSGPG